MPTKHTHSCANSVWKYSALVVSTWHMIWRIPANWALIAWIVAAYSSRTIYWCNIAAKCTSAIDCMRVGSAINVLPVPSTWPGTYANTIIYRRMNANSVIRNSREYRTWADIFDVHIVACTQTAIWHWSTRWPRQNPVSRVKQPKAMQTTQIHRCSSSIKLSKRLNW